jgi:hypothetical protein
VKPILEIITYPPVRAVLLTLWIFASFAWLCYAQKKRDEHTGEKP